MTDDREVNPSKEEGETDARAAASRAVSQNKERDEKEESSTSTGSDGGKGNTSGSGSGSGMGSGGGYNADCSSSDSSSTRVAEKEETIGNNTAGTSASKSNDSEGKAIAPKSRVQTISGTINIDGKDATQSKRNFAADGERGFRYGKDSSLGVTSSISNTIESRHRDATYKAKGVGFRLPQWNGVTIEHPMDPRIDLSTVGLSIGIAELAPFANSNSESNRRGKTNAGALASHNSSASYTSDVNEASKERNGVDCSTVPSPEQYTKLLESVRPFFNAHGIASQPNTTTSNEPENATTKSSTETNNAVNDMLNAAKDELAFAYASASAAAADQEDDENEKDSLSMVVLARPKRKHSTKQEGTDSNSGSSRDSSEEDLRMQQQPQQPPGQGNGNNEEGIVDENRNNGNDQAMMENPGQQQQQPQEQQNMIEDQQRYGFPSMVSEYSSSGRNGSSGASNTNMMSTSGSGSGGNTGSGSGSGTGSGSNQGGSSGSGNDQLGSSGSGNDQGLMSSNGNGSSGSGNDKGSSEEIMSNNMEGSSTENSKDNSDRSSQDNIIKNKVGLQETSTNNLPQNLSEPNDTERQNAAREKRFQDKKRKRMNMRKVYEDQMEQNMKSSDSNNEKGVLHPGKPVTLDNAISFTKTAKLVVKSSPSLTVIYANAAYIRLSGIDSHSCVGNHITSFLYLPSQQVSELDYKERDPSPAISTVNLNQSEEFNSSNNDNQAENDSKKHVAAEAAGRARAAASVDDDLPYKLEKLIVASGNGKLIQVNVRCKPHKMSGRNVKVFKSAVPLKRTQETRSDGSSITSSYDGPYNFVTCRMSISPVVSSPEIYGDMEMMNKDRKGDSNQFETRSENEHEGDQKSKRRKHHRTMNEIIHNRKRQVISHYVIQLEPYEGEPKSTNAERESHLKSIDGGMLGLSDN